MKYLASLLALSLSLLSTVSHATTVHYRNGERVWVVEDMAAKIEGQAYSLTSNPMTAEQCLAEVYGIEQGTYGSVSFNHGKVCVHMDTGELYQGDPITDERAKELLDCYASIIVTEPDTGEAVLNSTFFGTNKECFKTDKEK